jgi:hypothetical protein
LSLSDDIRSGVSEGLGRLVPHLCDWAKTHIVEPRPIRAALDVDGRNWCEFMLVTDDVGHADSSCRVVFDPSARSFGLVMQLQDGPLWYMGVYGSFDAAIANM